MPKTQALVPVERIESRILLIRGHKVMLDADLAGLYGVQTKALTRAVRRNLDRFPDDFMFQLDAEEFANLRRQAGTSSQWGGRRYPPYAFTEQGVAMLSSVLRSKRAVLVNIEIMRAFVRLRRMLASHADLQRRLDDQRVAQVPHFGLAAFQGGQQSAKAYLRSSSKRTQSPGRARTSRTTSRCMTLCKPRLLPQRANDRSSPETE